MVEHLNGVDPKIKALDAKQIAKQGEKGRRLKQELAERAGLSRATLQKIERGDLSVAVGSVFEVAVLVGVSLFDEEFASLPAHIVRAQDRLSLLPRAARKRRTVQIDDDF